MCSYVLFVCLHFLYDVIVVGCCCVVCFFFFKQKTAYELRISDWSSDVCSSDLLLFVVGRHLPLRVLHVLGDLLGSLAWQFDSAKRQLSLRNIELCFPELPVAEQRTMAYRATCHYYKSLIEYPQIGRAHV